MSEETYGSRKAILFAVPLFFAALTFSILAAETILRFVYYEQEAHGNYWGAGAFSPHVSAGYVHAAGFEGRAFRSGVFSIPVSINRLNLRQTDLETQLRYPSKLLVLGDSFCFGLGVLEEQSFPSLIRGYLNARDIGMINGAQTGYSVEQERLFGVPLMAQIRPDSVILGLFPKNDIDGDYFKGYQNIDVEYGYRLRKDRWLAGEPVDYFRTHSYLWMLFQNILNSRNQSRRQAEFEALVKRPPDEVVGPTLTAVRKLRDYCESHHIAFGVVMIPPPSGSTPFDTRLRAFFQEQRIPALDLGSKGYDESDYFSGDGHWNAKGHEKTAELLVPFLADLLKKH